MHLLVLAHFHDGFSSYHVTLERLYCHIIRWPLPPEQGGMYAPSISQPGERCASVIVNSGGISNVCPGTEGTSTLSFVELMANFICPCPPLFIFSESRSLYAKRIASEPEGMPETIHSGVEGLTPPNFWHCCPSGMLTSPHASSANLISSA